MNITWYGHSCFKLQSKDIVIITDPFDKKIGLRPPYGAANIVTVSHNHYDHNNFEAIKGNPFVVDSAGEFEIKKITIKGIDSFHDNSEGKERGNNIIYVIEMEGMNICHMGDFGQEGFINSQLEKIGQIDVLFIPIGGVFTIDWKIANTIISQIEPRIIIPMHYKISGVKGELLKLDSADNFYKERGVSSKDVVEKFSIKKKDLPQDEAKIAVMKIA
ncbi:MAG: MBL fold metallo-hydrolase [Candidatus Pacebacteria bacterium]|nr:MBL fold metallo-hydrolase [Candidatus Paceibacterota bacterium]